MSLCESVRYEGFSCAAVHLIPLAPCNHPRVQGHSRHTSIHFLVRVSIGVVLYLLQAGSSQILEVELGRSHVGVVCLSVISRSELSHAYGITF
jgi:hypothetical protein